MGGAHSWRTMPNKKDTLDFMKSYHPQNKEVSHLRILLHGPVGAGKSSFINSVDSVLQGRVTGRALTDATSGSSFTKAYKTYEIKKHAFVFNDIMGLEKNINNGVHVEDLKLALRGHVKEGYKKAVDLFSCFCIAGALPPPADQWNTLKPLFIPERPMTESDSHYNSSPTLDDRVHALVCVIPANSVSLLSDGVVKKMREVRLAASEMGIPQVAILTKVDEACPEAKKDIKTVYSSEQLKKLVDEISALLGLPPNCIFLIKNYESEIALKEGIDELILCALRQMINFGEDFLNNL